MNWRLLILFLLSASTAPCQSVVGLRHFMQSTPSPAGAIPYGNNPRAGQYVKANDHCGLSDDSKSQLSIIPGAPHPVFLANFPAVWASITPFLQH